MRYRRVKMARAVKRMGAIIGSQRAKTCKNEGDYKGVFQNRSAIYLL